MAEDSAAAIPALKAKIAELEAETNKLTTKNNDLSKEIDELNLTNKDDYQRIIGLQEDVRISKQKVAESSGELDKEKSAHRDTTSTLGKVQQDLDRAKDQCNTIRNTLEDTRSDLEHEKAAAIDRETFLNKAYADKTDAEHARKQALDARDQAEYNLKDKELQFEDLLKQWQEAQAKIDEYDDQLRAIERIQDEHDALEADVDRLQDIIADHTRTLTVKDERITHLETLYQKERQRNLNAAAAQDAILSMPGSPVHEQAPAPLDQLLSTGDTLEDELANFQDEDDYEYELEPQQLDIFEPTTVFAYSPILPASHDLAVTVNEAVQVSPKQASIPNLSLHSMVAGSTSPTVPGPPQLTISIDQATQVEPTEPVINMTSTGMQTESAQLTTAMIPSATFNISPIEPFEVIDPPSPRLTATVVEDAAISVAPVAVPEQPVQHALADMALAPITVVHEELPTDIPTKRPTSDASAQVTMTTEPTTEPTTETASQPIELPTKKSNSFFNTMNVLLTLLAGLTFICLQLYMELNAWRWANGVGYNRNYNAPTGAFGNRRLLFGFIPIADSIDNGPFSESIARLMSAAIMRFEDWAGVDNTPLY